ncbi:Uncharacterized protein FWK35_00001854 [Aphis craccivora]|uniref:Pre-C2HC domain-containing protein n=1 Tax=Aphis craccivora TaxID=307492 RepID=A0A6G0ZE51_APHCR|nr:Uncharacterized protein FWK35_00001854 [Aphis craccivora]
MTKRKEKYLLRPIDMLPSPWTHLPEVFSPPPVTEPSSHQGLDTRYGYFGNCPFELKQISTNFIKNLTNLSKLRNTLSLILGLEEFNFKSSKDFLIINTADCTSNYKVVEYLVKTNLSFLTFAPRHDLPTQAVIRHLHYSIPVEDIETALTELGFYVLNVHPFLNRVTKSPLSLFSVNLEPIESSLNIFKLTKLLNSIITVEKPRKSCFPPQCMKC